MKRLVIELRAGKQFGLLGNVDPIGKRFCVRFLFGKIEQEFVRLSPPL